VGRALRNAVVNAYAQASAHRYYELKRSGFGLDTMQVWDRNAPLPMTTLNRQLGARLEKTVSMPTTMRFDSPYGRNRGPPSL